MTNALAIALAALLYAEARSEGERGMRGVASVIHARAVGNPARMQAVIARRGAFTAYPSCRLTAARAKMPADMRALATARKIAGELAAGKFKPTVTANHYHSVTCRPRWSRRMQYVTSIGDHKFYFDKRTTNRKG